MPWDGNLFDYYTEPSPTQGGPVMPAPAPAPTPVPAPGSTPAPGQGGQTPQQLAQWVQDLLGNQGGANGNHGAFGGSAGGNGGMFGINGNGQGGYAGINLGPWGARLLQASTFAPGWAGIGMSALQAALRGANTITADQNNRALGAGGLGLDQILGSILGLNNYGSLSGNQTYVNRAGTPSRPGVAVTQGGIYDNDPLGNLDLFGLFSDPRTADTYQESVDRRSLAPGGIPAGYVQYAGSLKEAPAGTIVKNGVAYAPGGGGGGTDRNGNLVAGSYSGRDTSSPYGPNDTTSRNSVTGMLGHI